MSGGVRQPALGLVGTIVAVGGSMVVVSFISVMTLENWLMPIFSAVVPLQLLVAVIWNHQWPVQIARLAQPEKGIAYTVLFGVFGLIVSALTITLLGAGITPPNPVPVSFLIYAVQIAIWIIIGFDGWPASLIKSPTLRTVATLGFVYGLTFLLFRLLFNFSHLQGAPFYVAGLDPRGAFVSWAPLTFTMATVGVLLTLIYFDMQPLAAIARRFPAFARQPVFGLGLLMFSAVFGGALWFVGTRLLAIEYLVFLAYAEAAYVFGVLMVINLFEMAGFVTLAQPWRGMVLTGATLLLAVAIVPVFRLLSTQAFGPLASGPPTFDFELWLVSVLLAITFPLLSLYAGAFEFWPFCRHKHERT